MLALGRAWRNAAFSDLEHTRGLRRAGIAAAIEPEAIGVGVAVEAVRTVVVPTAVVPARHHIEGVLHFCQCQAFCLISV